jgi:hypothetical protein
MSLDVTLRGILERNIDSIIEGIPQLIEVHRKDKIPEMKITTETGLYPWISSRYDYG